MTDPRDQDTFDDPGAGRIAAIVDPTAELAYRVEDDVLVVVHTEVPERLSGRGLGGALVRAAVGKAAAEGLKVRPECPFARSWIERHPDETASVAVV
jgi:predicted GNAT family acetyltransferase